MHYFPQTYIDLIAQHGKRCGNPFDTALVASHLIYGGVLDAFPKLEVSLPYAGAWIAAFTPVRNVRP